MNMTGLQIDWETADRITVFNLIDTRDNCLNDLYKWQCNLIWMHHDDVTHYIRRVQIINELLEYFGEQILSEHQYHPDNVPEKYLELKKEFDPLNPDTYPEETKGDRHG
jgi:hypothetical protein